MSKQLYNRTAELPIRVEYEDVDGTTYKVDSKVTVNSSYEVEAVHLICFQAFNQDGDNVEPHMSQIILQQLETMAGAKALEKIEPVDFEQEAERE